MKTLRLLPNLSSLSIGAPSTSEGEGGGVHSLVAKCLFYDFGTYSTGEEGKYASEKVTFDSSQNFVDTFKFMLNNFKYASDLSTKKLDFAETKLTEDTNAESPNNAILAILEQAQNRLRKGGARAYYLRRDLSDKRAVYVVGDVHGSLHSLCEIFTHMNEELAFDVNGRLKDEVHVVFTGDIMDRSPYTLECAYLVLRLFVENPQNVTLTLGNHEKDAYLWKSTDGSRREMEHEYPESFDRLLRNSKIRSSTSLGLSLPKPSLGQSNSTTAPSKALRPIRISKVLSNLIRKWKTHSQFLSRKNILWRGET